MKKKSNSSNYPAKDDFLEKVLRDVNLKSATRKTNGIRNVAQQQKEIKIKKWAFLKIVVYYYQIYFWQFVTMLFFIIFTAGITIATPKVTNILFSKIAYNPHYLTVQTYLYYVIGFLLAFLLALCFRYFRFFVGNIIARKIEINMRLKIINKLIDLEIGFYRDQKLGDILTRLISDTNVLGQQTYEVPANFIYALVTFVGSLIVLFTLQNNVGSATHPGQPTVNNNQTEIELALIIISVAVIFMTIIAILFIFARRYFYHQRKEMAAVNGDLSNRLTALKLVKANGTFLYEKERFVQVHRKYYQVAKRVMKINAWIWGFGFTFFTSLNIITILIAVQFVRAGKLNPLVMIAFTMGIQSLIFPFIQLVNIVNNITNASACAWRIQELLINEPKIMFNEDKPALQTISGKVEIKKLDFYYQKATGYVFKDFSFTFQPNQKYAVVGKSGMGKSTLVALLLKMYEPIRGQILIDGQNLQDLNLSSYLNHVGLVEQEPQILYGSIYDNIIYGRFHASKVAALGAAKKANLIDFINSLPDGIDTIVGEQGFTLSGGQKQRICLARVFLRNPQLLILDEPTSSLDHMTEHKIQQEINSLMQNRTVIMVTHRLSTVRRVDQIIVLGKKGNIIETGTYDELIKKPGYFRSLYEIAKSN